MRYTSENNCENCAGKCEIFYAFAEDNKLKNNNIIHADFKKGEVISRQGGVVSHLMYLKKGMVKVYTESKQNKQIILYLLKAPAYLGLLSFFECNFYLYSIAALENSEVCFYEINMVKNLYTSNIYFFKNLNSKLGENITEILQKTAMLNQKQIKVKMADCLIYLSKLYNSNRFIMPVNRKELGNMAAITEETAVRLLTEFAKDRIISIKGRETEILDMSLLKKISETE